MRRWCPAGPMRPAALSSSGMWSAAGQSPKIPTDSRSGSEVWTQCHDRSRGLAGGSAPGGGARAVSRHSAREPHSQSSAAARDRDRQPERRRRQDHDRHQSRHRACRHRRAGADPRSRSPGQCFDRARHRSAQSPLLDLRRADGRSDLARCRVADSRSAALHCALDARSLRRRTRSQPGARARVSAAYRARRRCALRRAPATSPMC